MFKLTARQIKNFDELSADKKAVKLTFEIAMAFHSNRVNELIEKEKDLWKELGAIHDIDLFSCPWKITMIDGTMQLVRNEEDDND